MVAYRRAEADEPMPRDGTIRRYEKLRAPAGYWCADPFLVERGGETWLFCEMVRRYTRRGVIGCCKLTGEENPLLRPILQLPCHTSYPAVFRYGGQYYMVPETLGSRSVELYRAVHFPCEWKHERTLLSGVSMVDTTPVVENGRVTLYFYEPDDERGVHTLSSAELNMSVLALGERTVRRVYTEKRGRGAGGFFTENGVRMRPSQDNRAVYGGRIEYMAVSEEGGRYVEEPAGVFSPESIETGARKGFIGLHTVNRAGGFEAVDLFYRSFSLLRPIEALRFRLERFL